MIFKGFIMKKQDFIGIVYANGIAIMHIKGDFSQIKTQYERIRTTISVSTEMIVVPKSVFDLRMQIGA